MRITGILKQKKNSLSRNNKSVLRGSLKTNKVKSNKRIYDIMDWKSERKLKKSIKKSCTWKVKMYGIFKYTPEFD